MATRPKAASQNLTPNWASPITDPASPNRVSQTWFEFFTRLTAKPQAIVGVTVTASPFAYTASANGQLSISGGSVSQITFTRARVTNVETGMTSGLVPMSQGDIVTVAYSAPPNISFIPN